MGIAKTLIRNTFELAGFQITRSAKGQYKDFLVFENDEFFNPLYRAGLKLTSTPDGGHKRKARFFNLVQFYNSVRQLDGRSAECGCWNGLSSYLICKYEQVSNNSFRGETHEIYDSFEGLSDLGSEDSIIDPSLRPLLGTQGGKKGDFAATEDRVRDNLKEFGEIRFNKGWIPDAFPKENDTKYKFVHVDVDLYEPTLKSLEYFFPRMVPGGIIICDDYGSLRWPGAKKAVEEFCKGKCNFVVLSTGQALIHAADSNPVSVEIR
ncbi:TylF/MycF/NovP-related O-methyltransferase [Rhizobium sp. 1399]|uniref:TylF/MycF/NovP-related O-methyltransferase n=1 Tax=Rhizobium sp. 1399 TaxID=2817758 RepID=UPI0028571C17|nr:TylF/MycF/NovP-related O-methyltransferase [Rhizobium sp. 1399]MDR6671379.1 hypothetical protein [Rhizobium sp. 1399]